MKRGRLITIWFLALVAIGGALLMAVLHNPEPSFQGRTLSEWMEKHKKVSSMQPVLTDAPRPFPTEAVEAIRSMGQPAVDAFLNQMTARDSPLKLKLVGLARKQSLIKVNFQPAHLRRGWAKAVLCDLGSSASNAVPTLVEWLSEDDWSDRAGLVLASIGQPSVEPLRTRLAHGDPKDRLRAAYTLGWIGPEAAPAVPQLIEFLSDTNQWMRGVAIRALGAIGVPRDEIEQRLIVFLHQPEHALDAASGLISMGSDSVPVLTRALTNEHSAVRMAGLGGLRFWQEYRRRAPAERERNPVQWRQRTSSMLDWKILQGTFQPSSAGTHQAQVMALIGNLEDPDPHVRELSAAMLAGFPTEAGRSLPALDKCLGDASAGVRTAARRSVEQLVKSLVAKPTPPKEEANRGPQLGPGAVLLSPRRATP